MHVRQGKRASRARGMSSKRKEGSKDTRAPKHAREDHSSIFSSSIQAPPPPEILSMIFAYVPLYPRLHVLSFVCKRWRALVLRSVRSAREWRHLEHITTLFPCLEEIFIESGEMLLVVPQELRSLEIREAYRISSWDYDECCYAEVVAHNPRNLTSLRVYEHGDCRALVPLLKSCQSTLREV